MSQRQIIFLAVLTLVIMGGLGFYFSPLARDVNVFAFLEGHFPLSHQIVIGLFVGLIISLIGWQIIMLPYLTPVRDFFAHIIGGLRLSTGQIIFISICAGVGEEFLFRGAIQPVLGIWLTSFIFVFIHGYLNPFNKRLFLYGIFMTLSIAIIGFLTEKAGIVSSMTAHTVIDIYLLHKLTYPDR